MAWTVSRVKSVFGDKRAVILNMTADAATQTVESGLAVIEGISTGYLSCSSGAPKVYFNSNASGVQSFGVLGLSGFTSGDQISVVVYGR